VILESGLALFAIMSFVLLVGAFDTLI